MFPGDPRRGAAPPTDVDRTRTVELLRAHWTEGRLSSRELDEAIERAYRARSLDELAATVGPLEGTTRLRAGVVASYGLGTASPRSERSFLQRQLMYTGIWFMVWIVIWAVTGAGLVWFVLIIVSSATGLAFRLARGDRGRSSLFGARSRRSLGR